MLSRVALFSVAACAVCFLTFRLGAQVSAPPSAAGYGAIYRTIDLFAVTGNNQVHGVVHLGGSYFVSGTVVPGSHVIYRIDPNGTLMASFPQPPAQQMSMLGITDMTTDGVSLIGGSDMGISVFDTSGNQVNVIRASLGLQAISQPITGPGLPMIGGYQGVGFDPSGNGGLGSIWTGNGPSNILEIDLAGNVLVSHPNPGVNLTAIIKPDPCNGFPWLSADLMGRIVEFARPTGLLTGNFIPRFSPTSQSRGMAAILWGDSTMDWSMGFGAVSIDGSVPPRLVLHRIHGAFDIVPPPPPPPPPPPWESSGYDEAFLEIGVNMGQVSRGPVPFNPGDLIKIRVNANNEAVNGNPAFIGLNVEPDSSLNARTTFPGFGVFPEMDLLNPFSAPAGSGLLLFMSTVGTQASATIPPGFSVMPGYKIKGQALYVNQTRGFASAGMLIATNTAYFVN